MEKILCTFWSQSIHFLLCIFHFICALMEEDDGVKKYERENISCLALCEGHKSDFKFPNFFLSLTQCSWWWWGYVIFRVSHEKVHKVTFTYAKNTSHNQYFFAVRKESIKHIGVTCFSAFYIIIAMVLEDVRALRKILIVLRQYKKKEEMNNWATSRESSIKISLSVGIFFLSTPSVNEKICFGFSFFFCINI